MMVRFDLYPLISFKNEALNKLWNLGENNFSLYIGQYGNKIFCLLMLFWQIICYNYSGITCK